MPLRLPPLKKQPVRFPRVTFSANPTAALTPIPELAPSQRRCTYRPAPKVSISSSSELSPASHTKLDILGSGVLQQHEDLPFAVTSDWHRRDVRSGGVGHEDAVAHDPCCPLAANAFVVEFVVRNAIGGQWVVPVDEGFARDATPRRCLRPLSTASSASAKWPTASCDSTAAAEALRTVGPT